MKEQTINTLQVADLLHMNHHKLMRKLEGASDRKGLIEFLNANNYNPHDYFISSTYRSSKGRKNKCYKITRQGYGLLINNFTGKRGAILSAEYVKHFDKGV